MKGWNIMREIYILNIQSAGADAKCSRKGQRQRDVMRHYYSDPSVGQVSDGILTTAGAMGCGGMTRPN